MNEDDFLRAIAADRADRPTRLVFSDWLTERGDDRAEFVHLDTALRGMTGDEPAFAEAEGRWREWRGRLPRLWLTAFGHLFTSEELMREAARAETYTLVAAGLRTVAVLRQAHFIPNDFLVPDGEEHLTLVCGRRDVMSGLRFWLETLHHDIGVPQHALVASYLCVPLAEPSWRRRIEGVLSRLRQPPPSPHPEKSAFIAAVEILGMTADWGLLAAYEQEYVAAVWWTTA